MKNIKLSNKKSIAIFGVIAAISVLLISAVLLPLASSDASAVGYRYSTITISIAPSSIQTGKIMHASCTLVGSPGTSAIAGAKVNLLVTLPNGKTTYPAQGSQTTTDSYGKFSIDYTPTTAGTYRFTATYAGSNVYLRTSNSVSFSAVASTLNSSSIALTLSSSTIETGKSMHADGLLSAGAGIAGATVNLKVTKPDGTVASPTQGATMTTDSAGKFSIDYTPTVAGTYKFTASYAGNTQYASSSNNVSFSATAPSTPPTSTQTYDYTLSSNVVKNAAGSTVYTGSDFGYALRWAVGQANKITYVPAGTYTVYTTTMALGSTLYGDGSGKTIFTQSDWAFVIRNTDNVALKGFTANYCSIDISTTDGGTHGSYTFTDVTLQYTPNTHAAAFELFASSGTMNGLTFTNCKAMNPDTNGWQLAGGGYGMSIATMHSSNMWIKNVIFTDCIADHCGVKNRVNIWTCGWANAEGVNLENIQFVRCHATYNWMDGFHHEGYPWSTQIVYDSCESSYNGVGKDSGANAGWVYWPSAPYNNVVTLNNCYAVGNYGGQLAIDNAYKNTLPTTP